MNKPTRGPRATLALLVAALASTVTLAAASAPSAPASSPSASAADGRVIVFGFDGADARTVRELMEARPDDYPNFRRLASEGSFEPLEGVAPPESPVSWASLNTGQNPAKTNVPGFVKRNFAGSGPSGVPVPGLGHLGNEKKPIEELENTPIPVWSATKYATVLGGAGFLVGFLLFLLLTRRLLVAGIVGLLLGAAGAYGGSEVRGYLPDAVPRTTNQNVARNFWDYAGDAGVNCVLIDPAQAFDMPTPDCVDLLAGFGVPDARGGLGDWFLYTTDPDEFSKPPKGRTKSLTAGTVFRVDEFDGVIQTRLYGPKNFWREEQLSAELAAIDEELKNPGLAFERSLKLTAKKSELQDELRTVRDERTNVEMTIERAGGKALVTIDGQTQELAEGQWSDFYELEFAMNPVLSAHAITRVRIIHLDDPFFHMFVNVLDIDPRSPPFWQPISSPFDYSAEVAERTGLFETYGWPTATMPFKDGLIPPELLLEDVEFTLGWRERATFDQLARDDWRVFMSVFSTTDRIQHMLYRYYDEGAPVARPRRVGEDLLLLRRGDPALRGDPRHLRADGPPDRPACWTSTCATVTR